MSCDDWDEYLAGLDIACDSSGIGKDRPDLAAMVLKGMSCAKIGRIVGMSASGVFKRTKTARAIVIGKKKELERLADEIGKENGRRADERIRRRLGQDKGRGDQGHGHPSDGEKEGG